MESIKIRRSRRIRRYKGLRESKTIRTTQPLCDEYLLCIILLYDFRLDVVRRVFFGKMCVCEEKKSTWKNIVLSVM